MGITIIKRIFNRIFFVSTPLRPLARSAPGAAGLQTRHCWDVWPKASSSNLSTFAMLVLVTWGGVVTQGV